MGVVKEYFSINPMKSTNHIKVLNKSIHYSGFQKVFINNSIPVALLFPQTGLGEAGPHRLEIGQTRLDNAMPKSDKLEKVNSLYN